MDRIVDELWYVYADEEVRRKRLKESRGYSDAKIDHIFHSQLPEEEFRRHCRRVIENNGDLQETCRQIDEVWQNCRSDVLKGVCSFSLQAAPEYGILESV
ncbi:MAG: dephospho-CoA kinase [Eisenbergiella sp.]